MNKRFSLLALVVGYFLIAPSALAADPHRTKINRYVCDYQIVKKGNRIEERRVIIKETRRSAVLVEYPVNLWGRSKRTKLETEISYDKYKFFTVETEHKIIK